MIFACFVIVVPALSPVKLKIVQVLHIPASRMHFQQEFENYFESALHTWTEGLLMHVLH